MPRAHSEPQPPAAKPRRIGRGQAILKSRCPACRKGEMFLHSTYKLNGFAHMYDECPHCGQDFRVEPGFYMSASYIGYVFYVVLILALTFSSFYFFPGLNDFLLIGGIIGITLLLIPINFRMSRTVCLHLIGSISYDPDRIYAESGYFVSEEGTLRRGKPRASETEAEQAE